MYMKKTKIIATVWPVTESEENLQTMYENGVNIIRFNFSHATHEHSKIIVERINKLNAEWKTNLSLLLDTKWPEIRTGIVEEKIKVQTWEIVRIVVDESKRQTNDIYCDYPYLLEDMQIGDIIIIDSGLCHVEVVEIQHDAILAKVWASAILWSKRHINLPWVRLKLPWITEKDKEDVLFAIENDYDFIAMSFVRNKENILELKDFLAAHNASHIKIISKVENQEAIENLEEIVQYSDGVMVARGDLWIEVPIQQLPLYQKKIWDLCLKYGKFFIIATHLLETMIENPFPTRAEVSDIYNSVLQYADCTMLSGETTTGNYPIQSIKMMTSVIEEAEKNMIREKVAFTHNTLWKKWFQKKILVKNALEVSQEIQAKMMIIFTQYGFLARMAAAYKTDVEMFGFTNNPKTHKFMNALFWVKPVLLQNFSQNYLQNLDEAIQYLKKNNCVTLWDKIVVVWDFQRENREYPMIEIVEV